MPRAHQRPLRRITCALTLFAALCPAAEHRGRVTFAGEAVPGATVKAASASREFLTLTGPDGTYLFPDLPAGPWTLRVEMLCFAPIERTLEPAPGTPPLEWQLELIPSPQLPLIPALATPAKPDPVKPDNAPLPDPSAEDALLMNGSASLDLQRRAFGNARRAAPGLLHGALSLTLDDSALNARPYSLTGQDAHQDAYHRLHGVASLGGPFAHTRHQASFFLAYDWQRNRTSSLLTGLVPGPALREGDLSSLLSPSGLPLRLFDPTTGAPFPSLHLPVSPQAHALLALYPLPNIHSASAYNYQSPASGSDHRDELRARFAARPAARTVLVAALSTSSRRLSELNLFSFPDQTSSSHLTANLLLRRLHSASFDHELSARFSRSSSTLTPAFANLRNLSAEAGITGNDQNPLNWGPPALSFSSGLSELADAQWSHQRDQTGALQYSAELRLEPHTLKFGLSLRRQHFDTLGQQDPRGRFLFTGAATQEHFDNLPVPGTGSDFADLLLGIPDALSLAYGNADKYLRTTFWTAHLVDDWRLHSALTLNLGLRWDYATPASEKYGRLSNLALSPDFTSASAYSPGRVPALEGRAFQPRLGLAWRPAEALSSLLLRAGFGLYFDSPSYETLALRMAQQPPFSTNLSLANSPLLPLSLAHGFSTPFANSQPTFAVDPHFRRGYARLWQLSLEQNLPAALVATLGYSATSGLHAGQQSLPNTFPSGASNPCPACPSGFLLVSSNGNSTRHAAHAELRRRLQSGLAANLRYTLARAIDNAQLGGPGRSTPVVAQNWLDLSAERGPSSFDQHHLLQLQAQFTSGLTALSGARLTGWRATLLHGWTASSELSAGSGLPLSPIYPALASGSATPGTIRPDATGLSPYTNAPGRALNYAAFRPPTPGSWGNAGRNCLSGPRQFSLNASLGRLWTHLELRVDLNNLLNHPTFPAWDSVITSSSFGLPSTANPMRSLHTTLRLHF